MKAKKLVVIAALLIGLNISANAQDAIYKEYPIGLGIPTGSIKETYSPTAKQSNRPVLF